MKQSLLSNPHWSPRVCTDHDLLRACVDKYARLQTGVILGIRFDLRPSSALLRDTLDHWYFELHYVRRAFLGDRVEFEDAVRGLRRYPRWTYSRVRTPFRHRQSFVRLPHHMPKVLDEREIQVREWHRDRKRDDRRRRRYWSNGKRWAKKCSNKYHRQFVRQAISTGRYDDLGWDSFRLFKDRWMYD